MGKMAKKSIPIANPDISADNIDYVFKEMLEL